MSFIGFFLLRPLFEVSFTGGSTVYCACTLIIISQVIYDTWIPCCILPSPPGWDRGKRCGPHLSHADNHQTPQQRHLFGLHEEDPPIISRLLLQENCVWEVSGRTTSPHAHPGQHGGIQPTTVPNITQFPR